MSVREKRGTAETDAASAMLYIIILNILYIHESESVKAVSVMMLVNSQSGL